ncbi:MAG: FtsB family cell division protein [Nitrospiraceae bacterium]
MTRRNRSHNALDRRWWTSRGITLIVGLAIGTVLVVSFFFDEMGVPKYLGMLRHAQQLEGDIRDLERTNAELQTEIHRVQHDPERIEELARERLGFVREGETVYQIVEETSK